MSEHSLHVSRRVEAPAAVVWEMVTDLPRAAERLSGVREVQLLTDGPYAVGTRWRETRRMLGRTATEEMWVAANDPLRTTVVAASSSGTDYRTTFRLTPLGTHATELTVDFAAETPDAGAVQKVLWRVFGPLGTRITRRALEQDLTDIAAAAQSYRGDVG